jgi:hypothetical protein
MTMIEQVVQEPEVTFLRVTSVWNPRYSLTSDASDSSPNSRRDTAYDKSVVPQALISKGKINIAT